MKLKRYFDRVVLINLKRRPDRLAKIKESLKSCAWPFKHPEIFAAVDGNVVPCPEDWQSGGGAWGCMRSHQQVLEKAITNGNRNVLVIEDDACFAENFEDKVKHFLMNVPDDWDQLMLGGQHINLNGTPTLIKPGVYRCTDCERTHCYAVRGEFMSKLYQRWVHGGEYKGEVHCDWIMGRDIELQFKHKVYAPEVFLVGQDRGMSDINGGIQPRKFWNPPGLDLSVLVLHAPKSALPTLRLYGIHTGYDRDPESDIDNGLLQLFRETEGNTPARGARLLDWINGIQWEVASDPYLICTLWHPESSAEMVRSVSKWPVYEVSGVSVEEILKALPPHLRKPYRPVLAKSCIIHLTASKRVMDGLRRQGWHNGYWRNDQNGFDNGLTQICQDFPEGQRRIEALAGVIKILQQEAEIIHKGIAVIWHPEIDAKTVKAATTAKVIEITSTNIRDALEIFQETKTSITNSLENALPVNGV